MSTTQHSPTAEELERMLDHPSLPELPDLNELLEQARVHRARYADIAERARVEVQRADDYITRLTGKPSNRPAPRHSSRIKTVEDRMNAVNETAYRRILTALAGHAYAGIKTLSGSAGYSGTHIGYAMKRAEQRGHVTTEQRGQRYRFTLTEAGMDYLTGPEVDAIRAEAREAS